MKRLMLILILLAAVLHPTDSVWGNHWRRGRGYFRPNIGVRVYVAPRTYYRPNYPSYGYGRSYGYGGYRPYYTPYYAYPQRGLYFYPGAGMSFYW